jgi:hypothetical protein
LVEISHRERVVRAKIIYYGPAAGGKTTNLVVLHQRADPKRRGEMVSVNSTQDRTILLDLLPMKTPAFRGYELRFQVIAVPGRGCTPRAEALLNARTQWCSSPARPRIAGRKLSSLGK